MKVTLFNLHFSCYSGGGGGGGGGGGQGNEIIFIPAANEGSRGHVSSSSPPPTPPLFLLFFLPPPLPPSLPISVFLCVLFLFLLRRGSGGSWVGRGMRGEVKVVGGRERGRRKVLLFPLFLRYVQRMGTK